MHFIYKNLKISIKLHLFHHHVSSNFESYWMHGKFTKAHVCIVLRHVADALKIYWMHGCLCIKVNHMCMTCHRLGRFQYNFRHNDYPIRLVYTLK